MSVVILFCANCGSHLVDVKKWEEDGLTCVIYCSECNSEFPVKGLTIGRVLHQEREGELRLVANASKDISEPRNQGQDLLIKPAVLRRLMEKLEPLRADSE